MKCTEYPKETNILKTAVVIKHFSIITDTPEEFINELEKLCINFSGKGKFFFKYSFEE